LQEVSGDQLHATCIFNAHASAGCKAHESMERVCRRLCHATGTLGHSLGSGADTGHCSQSIVEIERRELPAAACAFVL
jgi:hypothetical protein